MHREHTERRGGCGLFITVEGVTGSGKSTVIGMLGERLRAHGFQVVITHDQSGTAVGRRIRDINLKCTAEPIEPLTEALLIAAARHHHVVQVVRPALAAGKVVICEYFTDGFIAYQGFGRGLSTDLLECISEVVAAGMEPDISILLDTDPVVGLGRLESQPKHRIDNEPLSFHRRVRAGYLVLAEEHPDRIRVYDASHQVGTVLYEIWVDVHKTVTSSLVSRSGGMSDCSPPHR